MGGGTEEMGGLVKAISNMTSSSCNVQLGRSTPALTPPPVPLNYGRNNAAWGPCLDVLGGLGMLHLLCSSCNTLSARLAAAVKLA